MSKDPVKGNSVENVRPVTCIPLMWRLLTGIISEDMYCFMETKTYFQRSKRAAGGKVGEQRISYG